jgi:hypothetical protein
LVEARLDAMMRPDYNPGRPEITDEGLFKAMTGKPRSTQLAG